MAFDYALANGDIVELRVLGAWYGQATITTWHYLIGSGATTSTDMTDLVNEFFTDIWADWKGVVSSRFVAQYIQGQRIRPTRAVPYTRPLTEAEGTGAVDEESVPLTTSVVIRKLTNLAGPSNRGRWFLPGLPATYYQGGLLTTTGLSIYTTLGAGISASLTFGVGARTATAILYSTQAHIVRGPIAGTVTDDVLRVQRRREVGRGI